MEIIAITFAVTVLGWFLCRLILIGQMSNVHQASGADDYLMQETINITEQTDTYLCTKVSRRPKLNKK